MYFVICVKELYVKKHCKCHTPKDPLSWSYFHSRKEKESSAREDTDGMINGTLRPNVSFMFTEKRLLLLLVHCNIINKKQVIQEENMAVFEITKTLNHHLHLHNAILYR